MGYGYRVWYQDVCWCCRCLVCVGMMADAQYDSHIILIVFRAFIQMGCMCLMANPKDWDCLMLDSSMLIRYTVNGKEAFRSGNGIGMQGYSARWKKLSLSLLCKGLV